MYTNLLNMLIDEQQIHDEEFHIYSKEEAKMRPVFDLISDKYGKLDYSKYYKLAERKDCYDIAMDTVENENEVLFHEIADFLKKANEITRQEKQDNGLYESARNVRIIGVPYKQYAEIREEGQKVLMHISEIFFEVYERTKKIKEEEKELSKNLTRIIKNIRTKKELIPADLAYLLTVIDDIEDETLKDNVSFELDGFLKEIRDKKTQQKKQVIEEKPQEITHHIQYIDNDIDEVVLEEDSDYINYYNTLKTFTSLNDVKIFFDSIKHNKDITKIILKIIEVLEQDNNVELINYLNDYLLSLDSVENEEIDVKNNDTFETVVLYDGFLSGRKTIQGDLDAIPKETYDIVKIALDKIKKDGAESKRTGLIDYKKIFKLRYKSIRIYFRKLSKNVYLILGIFVKKSKKDSNIISAAVRRNTRLGLVEDDIVSAIGNDKLWSKYLEANSRIDDVIEKMLKNKIKD